MVYFWLRALLSGLIVATIATIARRNPAAGALVASLPLVSLLGMIWLWHDTHDRVRLAAHAQATFFYVLPSLPMFLLIPVMLRSNVPFPITLAVACTVTILLYFLTVFIAARFGIRL